MSFEHVKQLFTLAIAWHDPLLHMNLFFAMLLTLNVY